MILFNLDSCLLIAAHQKHVLVAITTSTSKNPSQGALSGNFQAYAFGEPQATKQALKGAVLKVGVPHNIRIFLVER